MSNYVSSLISLEIDLNDYFGLGNITSTETESLYDSLNLENDAELLIETSTMFWIYILRKKKQKKEDND